MGLLDSLLEVPEHLRVWQMAGVRHFYLDPNAAEASSISQATPDAPEAAPQAVSEQALTQRPESRLETVLAPSEALPPEAAAPDAVPPPEAPAGPAPLPADPRDWPAPWPALFAKAPARPRLVIAYRELGFDLTGQADRRRGALWRDLIRDLGLSGQNAVAFWPLALPENDTLVDQPEAFAAGLALFSPMTIAVFGPLPPAVAEALTARPETARLRVVTLPHPEELLQGDPEVWDHVCALLTAG